MSGVLYSPRRERAAVAEHVHRALADVVAELGGEQLHHHAGEARVLAARLHGEQAVAVVLAGQQAWSRAGPGGRGCTGSLIAGLPRSFAALRHHHQAVEGAAGDERAADQGALVLERRAADDPALAARADEVLLAARGRCRRRPR